MIRYKLRIRTVVKLKIKIDRNASCRFSGMILIRLSDQTWGLWPGRRLLVWLVSIKDFRGWVSEIRKNVQQACSAFVKWDLKTSMHQKNKLRKNRCSYEAQWHPNHRWIWLDRSVLIYIADWIPHHSLHRSRWCLLWVETVSHNHRVIMCGCAITI